MVTFGKPDPRSDRELVRVCNEGNAAAERFPAREGFCPDDLPGLTSAEPGDIARVLRELTDERREVVLLRFVDDLSLEVKSRLHLAIRQLRESPEIRRLHFP